MNTPRATGVYALANCRDGKRYIGSAEDLYTRRHSHFSLLRYGKHSNPHLQAAYNREPTAFVFEILTLCDKHELREREQAYIDKCRASERDFGYNMAAVAVRIPLNPEVRAKLATCKKGHVIGESTKKKIAATLTGRKLGPQSSEHRARIAAALRGKPKTLQHRAKVAAARAKQSSASLSHPHTEATKRLLSRIARARAKVQA